jgi:hypothetical protein
MDTVGLNFFVAFSVTAFSIPSITSHLRLELGPAPTIGARREIDVVILHQLAALFAGRDASTHYVAAEMSVETRFAGSRVAVR